MACSRCGINSGHGVVRTNAFDIAFARDFALTHVGRDIRHDYPELFSGRKDLLGDLTEIAGSVSENLPGGKLVFNLVAHLSERAAEWYQRRGRRILDTLDDLSGRELRESLPVYLGFDLCAVRAGLAGYVDGAPVRHVRGAVARGGGGVRPRERRAGRVGATVGSRDAGRGVRHGGPGRKLGWGEVDPAWDDVTVACALDDLAPPDQQRYLRTKGVTAPAIIDRIVAVSGGHALTMSVHARNHAAIVARGGDPTDADFPPTLRETLDRFVDHFPASLRALSRLVAVPGELEEPLWQHLARTFSVFELHSFTETLADVFFRRVGEGRLPCTSRCASTCSRTSRGTTPACSGAPVLPSSSTATARAVEILSGVTRSG